MCLQKEPEDPGQILAALALDIQKRKTRLNEIRLRERRATLLVTLYTFAGWGAYLGLWYAQLLPRMSKHRPNSEMEKAIKGFPAVLGPIMYVIPPRFLLAYTTDWTSRILFTRRIVQLWFNRKGNAEGQWHRQGNA
jgi:endoplasmic reticulum junction formation protein lunapark